MEYNETTYNKSNWRDGAACLDQNPEDFFPEGGESKKVPDWIAQLCGECAVKALCLEDAIETHQKFGIRAGVNLASGTRSRSAAWRRAQRAS